MTRISSEKERELNELKSRFLAVASHEFRTPLSSILSSVELIGEYHRESQKEKREVHIQRIKSSVEALVEILNDFHSLSKLQQGEVKVQAVEFLLGGLFEEVSLELESMLKQQQQLFHEDQTHTPVQLDRELLKNILINLLSNAIKYSKDGQPIRCSGQTVAQRLVIQVADQGLGIPAEDQKFLFQRFFRGHNVAHIQGVGLGLCIAKRYAEMMNGHIDFESTIGVGSTFTINLPLNASSYEKENIDH